MNPRSEWKVRRLRAQVAARDNWTCYRCRLSIDPTLRYPHPQSVSLEHIVELAAGGHPYDPANCSVSHLSCNREHGAKLGGRTIAARKHRKQRTELTW